MLSELPIFTVGRGNGIDFDDRDIGVRIDANDLRGAAVVGGIVGVGRELDENFVGLVDNVIVGDDVAARIDDEAGAKRFTNTAAIQAAAIIRTLRRGRRKAIEEVLEVVVRTLLLGCCSSSPGPC